MPMHMTAIHLGDTDVNTVRTWLVCGAIAFLIIHGYYFVGLIWNGDPNAGLGQKLVGAFVALYWQNNTTWWLVYLGMTLVIRIVWEVLVRVIHVAHRN
jgi:hypothetical protein